MKSEWKIMVMDDESTKIITTYCNVSDIEKYGVLLLQNIMYDRQKINMDAIYILKSTNKSISKFASEKYNQYKNIYLFIIDLDHVPKYITKIISKTCFFKKIKNISSLNINFYCHSDNVFLTNNGFEKYIFSSIDVTEKDLQTQINTCSAINNISSGITSFLKI